MSGNVHARIDLLSRRIGTIVGRARITSTNDSGPVQLVQIQVNDLETIDNVPRLLEFGLTSVAPAGTDVSMLNLGGARNNAAVIATGHQPSRPKGLQPGETMVYSEDGKSVYMTAAGGIVVDAKGQDVVVNNAKDVTWNLSGKLKITAPGGIEFDTPTVESTGDMQDNIRTNSHTMAEMRSIYDGHNHVVRGVQPGSSNITSDTPTQTE